MTRRRDKAEPTGSSTAGTVLLLIAVVFAAFPELRNWPLVASAAVAGLAFHLVGSGRVYRPAVTRVGETITCRFNPWREAAFYFVLIGLPALGLMAITGASVVGRGNPSFWRIVGAMIIASTLLPVFVFIRQSRGSLLSIDPSGLTLSPPGANSVLTQVPRSSIQDITAATARMRNHDSAPATQITYQDGSSSPATVLFGPTNTKKTAWLTVEQSDLLAGLQAWKDGDPDDPGLMDRVEQILCGKVPNSV